MKKCSEALNQLLLNNQVFYMADLYTITLTNGTVLRYTGCDIPLQVGGYTYEVLAIERKGTRQARGLSVDELTATVTTDRNDKIPGALTFMQGAAAGTFDNALLQLDRVFSPTPFVFNMAPLHPDYVMLWWVGILNIEEAGGLTVAIKAASMTQLLNTKFPRNLYYPSCIRTCGDSGCCSNMDQFAVKGKVVAVTSRSQVMTDIRLPDSYLAQGTLRFDSGANTNVTRSIKTNTGSGQIILINAFTSMPSPGDAFTVTPNCQKVMSRCHAIFNNLKNFRGYPFIPVPETSY